MRLATRKFLRDCLDGIDDAEWAANHPDQIWGDPAYESYLDDEDITNNARAMCVYLKSMVKDLMERAERRAAREGFDAAWDLVLGKKGSY